MGTAETGAPSLEPNSAAWCEVRAAEFLAKGDLRENRVEFEAVAAECVGTVIELGCAFGTFSRYLPFDRDYIGVDLSKLAVYEARKRCPERLFVWGDALALGKGWHKVADTAVAMQFLEHFPDGRYTLEQLRKLARKRVIVTVPVGLPAVGERETIGHLSGWRAFGELAELYDSATRLRMAPLKVAENHIGAVITW